MRSSQCVDVLTDLLERARARGAGFSHSTVRGPFGLVFPAVPGLAVHAIVEGEVHLWIDEDEPLHLLGGDIVLVRGGLDHRLATSPQATCRPLMEFMDSARVSDRRFVEGEGDPSVFFCGAYLFEGDICTQLLDLLPDTLRLRPAAGSQLRMTLDLLAREMEHNLPGQQTLLDRLLDVALVQMLREHFAEPAADAPGWYRASADPQLGLALRAVHAEPARPWTVESLAAEASLSRAAFARRFTAAVGMAPLAYVTDWRMALAREQLRDSKDQIAAVASTLGYASEFSFAAAFKRHHGVPPGRWRNEPREGAARRVPGSEDERAARVFANDVS